jgi:hypothetical protein
MGEHELELNSPNFQFILQAKFDLNVFVVFETKDTGSQKNIQIMS